MKRKVILIVIMLIVIGTLVRLLLEDASQNTANNQKKTYSRPHVKVKNSQLLADFDEDGQYEPYFIKGVTYNPTPIGRFPSDFGWKEEEEDRPDNIFDDEELLRRDFKILKEMGCNTIRIPQANSTYRKATKKFPNRITKKTLDLAEEYGLKVIAGFWIETKPPFCRAGKPIYKAPDFSKKGFQQKTKKAFLKFVNKFKKHPAILFWAIGNENNYHIDSLEFDQMQVFYALVNDLAAAAHKAERKKYHPVAFVNGDISSIGEIIYETTDIAMEHLDIWGANVYRGESFGDLFENYAERSEKPFWISEYGIDAWDSLDYRTPVAGGEDQETQAEWIGKLWDEIVANKEVAIGATVMEYSDEWWRPDRSFGRKKRKHYNTHDYFGIGPRDTNCDGHFDWYPSAPDLLLHAEWFGIMSVEDQILELDTLTPRKAYYTLQEKFGAIKPEKSN